MTDDQITEDVVEDVEQSEETTEELHGDEHRADVEDSFPREYVEKLRDENAKYRQRAGRADDLERRIHSLLVERTGRLADPGDLEFDPDHLDDEEALTAAVDTLLESKPHLASRRPTGDIGQGATETAGTPDLAALMRRAAN